MDVAIAAEIRRNCSYLVIDGLGFEWLIINVSHVKGTFSCRSNQYVNVKFKLQHPPS
jgi:hypothetical protein